MNNPLVLLLAGLLASCGSGDFQDREIVLDQPSQIVYFEEQGGAITFDILFDDFFKCVPNGHAGVMLRAATEQIPLEQYRGVGVVFGRFGNDGYTTRNLPHLEPVAVVETWGLGIVGPEFDAILPHTVTQLQDGILYKAAVASIKTTAGNYIRYSFNGYDSGYVLDINPGVDMDRKEIVFFNATMPGVAICSYRIVITNPRAQN
jgi:hypothetical protein